MGYASCERFLPALNHWEAMPPMLQTRERPAAVTVGGNLYVCGLVLRTSGDMSIYVILLALLRLRVDIYQHLPSVVVCM